MNKFAQTNSAIALLYQMVENKLTPEEKAKFCGLCNLVIQSTVSDVQNEVNLKLTGLFDSADRMYSSNVKDYQ